MKQHIGSIAYIGLLVLTAAILAGCASLDGKLENRIACTLAKDRAYVVSEYGPVGITGRVSELDRAVVCK